MGNDGIRHWIKIHRVPLLFALGALTLLFLRGFWSPDEPDFAQCVREMRLGNHWLLPYLNGVPYGEKPILFYWLMRISAWLGELLTGGAGFINGVAPWALRLPSAIAGIGLVWGLFRWTRTRFPGSAELAAAILATTPLWIWQTQYLQIDMVFAALLAGSWLAWLGAYLDGEARARRAFLPFYLLLALAMLAKGPLALVLTLALLGIFLVIQKDLALVRRMNLPSGLLAMLAILLPWYTAAVIHGGPAYAYEMIVRQNLMRAMHAWDHIQPWWRYFEYTLADGFPWILLLPAAAWSWRRRPMLPAVRFAFLAYAVPFVLLSCSQSKQGKYLLMTYPFAALALAMSWTQIQEPRVLRRWGALMLGVLLCPGLALLAVCLGAGGAKLQAQAAPFLGPAAWLGVCLVAGPVALFAGLRKPEGATQIRTIAISLGLGLAIGGAWAFHLLDPVKDYKRWAQAVAPILQGHPARFWGEIRAGAMIYDASHVTMPEIRTAAELDTLTPEDRLVVITDRWRVGYQALTPSRMDAFEILHRQQQGGDAWMVLKKRSTP